MKDDVQVIRHDGYVELIVEADEKLERRLEADEFYLDTRLWPKKKLMDALKSLVIYKSMDVKGEPDYNMVAELVSTKTL